MEKLSELDKALAGAMKSRAHVALDALRMLKTALVNKSVEKGRPLEDAESLQVVASLIKQRRDSIEQFRKGGREELAEKEAAEIAILERYLPPPADASEVDRIIEEAIAEAGAGSPKDRGRVMKLIMPRLAGKGVEGKLVSDRVREKLGG